MTTGIFVTVNAFPWGPAGEGFNTRMQRLWRQGLPPKVREARGVWWFRSHSKIF